MHEADSFIYFIQCILLGWLLSKWRTYHFSKDNMIICQCVHTTCKAASSSSYHFLLNTRFMANRVPFTAILFHICVQFCFVAIFFCSHSNWLFGRLCSCSVLFVLVSFILHIHPECCAMLCTNENCDIYYLETWIQERWPRIHTSSITFDSIQSIIMQSYTQFQPLGYNTKSFTPDCKMRTLLSFVPSTPFNPKIPNSMEYFPIPIC